MKKFMWLVLGIFILSFSFVSALDNVNFNGNWSPGDTLYSDNLFISDGYFYGKDVYPIRNCHKETVCKSYEYHYEKVCLKYSDSTGRCIKHQKNKIIDGCKRYGTISVCEKIGCTACMNPNGEYTNQLRLENFQYSLDGINWNEVPYKNDRIYLENSSIQFRLIIPSECSPEYYFNKAIYYNE